MHTHINLIFNQIGSEDCTWNNSTSIAETIPLYDLNDNVNAYIFNLVTDGNETGNVFVNARSNDPVVISFGYNGENSISNALDYNINLKKNDSSLSNFTFDKNKIYYVGGLVFLSKSTDNKYYDIETCKPLSSSKEVLCEKYNTFIQQIKNDAAINEYEVIKNNAVNSTYTNSVISSNSVSGISNSVTPNAATSGDLLYYNSMTLWVTLDFTDSGDCAPTAGMNILYYWAQYRGHPALISGWGTAKLMEHALYSDMAKISSNGVSDSQWMNGMKVFSSAQGVNVSGSDYVTGGSMTQSWVKANIANTNPFMVHVQYDPTYGCHSMTVLGWKLTGSTFYLRVDDGWTKTYSTFYNFGSGYVYSLSYVRYN